jgi:hypothetical protein
LLYIFTHLPVYTYSHMIFAPLRFLSIFEKKLLLQGNFIAHKYCLNFVYFTYDICFGGFSECFWKTFCASKKFHRTVLMSSSSYLHNYQFCYLHMIFASLGFWIFKKKYCCFNEISSRTNIVSILSTLHMIFASVSFLTVFEKYFVF